MSKTDWIATGLTVLLAGALYFVGGPWIAAIAVVIGGAMIVRGHMKREEVGEPFEYIRLPFPRSEVPPQSESTSGKPRLHVADKGFYADFRELRDGTGRLLAILSCLHVRFKNDPLQTDQTSIAKILAEIEYFDVQNNSLCAIRGRWGDTTQPPGLPPGQTVEDNLTNVVIHIGQVRELDIAFKYQDEDACYAMSNETYQAPDWRHPTHKLPVGTIRAQVRLRGAGVDDSWNLWFENPSTGHLKPLRQEAVTTEKLTASPMLNLKQRAISLADEPRPKIAVIQKNSMPHALVLTNVGERSAHNIRIVPDKSLGVWIEQVGNIDMMDVGGSPHAAEIAAMWNDENDQERPLYNSDQTLLEVIAWKLILADVNPPRLPFAVEYDGFGTAQHYVTRYRLRLDSAQHPSVEYLDG